MKENIDIFIDKDRNHIIIAEWRGGKTSGDIRQYEIKKSRTNMPKGDSESGFVKKVMELQKQTEYDHIGGGVK